MAGKKTNNLVIGNVLLDLVDDEARDLIDTLRSDVESDITDVRFDVADDISDLRSDVSEDIADVEAGIATVDARMDNLVTDINGAEVTTLWTGSLGTLNTPVTLSKSVSEFDFIDIYTLNGADTTFTRIPANVGTAQIHVGNLSDYASVDFLHYGEMGISLSGNKATLTKAVAFQWSPPAAPEVTSDTTIAVVTRIDGVKTSASVNAELADVRVGADGVTYGSAGAAVRGQINNVTADINDVRVIGDPVNPTYYSGYITASGTFGNGECRTTFLQFNSHHLTVSPLSGYKCRIAEYNADNVGSFSKFIAKDRFTMPFTFTPDPEKYYAIDVMTVNGTSITVDTVPVNAITYFTKNNTDPSLTLEGKAADAKAVGDKFIVETAKTALNIRSYQRPKVLFDMQAGHGFYNPLSAGNAPSDDTTDYIYGDQSVLFNYAGQSSFSAMNLSEMVLHVKLKVDTITSGASIVMYISDVSSMASCKIYTLYKSEPSNQFENGIWADVSVYADAGRIVGTPDLTKAKYIRFSVSDGSATYHIQSVGYRHAGKQKPCISFTFDDGWSEVMLGAKILGKYNIPATAYIFEGCQLTTEQLQSLKNNYGWDIELHSDSVFTEKTPSEIAEELQSLKNYIQNNGLGDGNHLAYAGGQNNIDVVNAVRKFCKTARTISMASSYNETVPPSMPYNLRAVTGVGASGQSVANVKGYIDKTVERNAWLILVFHRIGNTATSMFCSESDLEEIASYAAASGAEIKTVADMWERN